MNYLNLGCGDRFHQQWTNIDIKSANDAVISYNICQKIPYLDNSFDAVYHSHLLEHLTKHQAQSFLRECFRVLRPDGTLRVVVPDLEQIVKTYLLALKKVQLDFQEWSDNYDWILLEMYDQTVRNDSGGEMAKYLSKDNIINQDFILKRCGITAKNLIEKFHKERKEVKKKLTIKNKIKLWLKPIYNFVCSSNYRRELFLKFILKNEYDALQIGRFRQSGEVHQWMYDRYSLARLLEQCGLEKITQRTAYDSYIPNWTSFNLDTEPDGTIYKPDSLYMEAIKPSV
ncbi:MAG: methyltransferase domain-containing protein [Xenococcaceae cyanobacterium MO_167.B27]|nr:methyltransferase domain-containing protein [Xenococcaceae cyanobacterium MO_167.B27]